MSDKLKLKIVTPEKTLLDSEVDHVTIPTQMGQITVLPGHIPLVANLAPGEMKVVKNRQDKFIAVGGGVVEVRPGSEIVVLADAAEAEEEIDVKRAEEARERARKTMAEKTLSGEEYAATAAALEKALTRIRVATKRKYRKV